MIFTESVRADRRLFARMLAGLLIAALGSAAFAQTREYRLDESGAWAVEREPEPGSDEAVMAEAAALLAADQPAAARALLDNWIGENERTRNPWLPRAYLLRGDAKDAMGDEFRALFDYEREIILRFPQSEEFVLAIERELDIAVRYANGLRRKFLGMRIQGSGEIAEETLIRVQERLPGSELAERAAIELADYYYRRADLELASIAYDLYVVNYPNGPNVRKAMERRIRTNVAKYRGPDRDGSSLIDAIEQTQAYTRLYPADAERSGLDNRLVQRLEDALADQMLAGAEWYIKRGDLPSAKFTLRRLVRDRPNTIAAGEAIEIMDRYGWGGAAIGAPSEVEGDAK